MLEYREIEKFLQGFLKKVLDIKKPRSKDLGLKFTSCAYELEIKAHLERNTAHSEVA